MTTPRDLILLAMKQTGVIGVGQTPIASDINDCFTLLNQMVSQWARKRYMIMHLVNLSFTGTGQPSVTVGPSGDINTIRPVNIQSAFVRLSPDSQNPVDKPLIVLQALEDYNNIGVKNIVSMPSYIYLNPTFPLATVFTYPACSDQYEVFFSVLAPLERFDNLSQVIDLPPEYEAALMYGLCLRMAPMYGMAVSADLRLLAKQAVDTITDTNAQIPQLMLNVPNGRGWYNIFTDN